MSDPEVLADWAESPVQICEQAELGVTSNACTAGHVHSTRNRTKLITVIFTAECNQRMWMP